MVYSMQTGGWKGSRTLSNNHALVLCTSVGNAGGRGDGKDGCFVHDSLEVNEYLVKAKWGAGWGGAVRGGESGRVGGI